MNVDKFWALTTSLESPFQTLIILTAKKCCLQLTLDTGTTILEECPRVTEFFDNSKNPLADKHVRPLIILKQYIKSLCSRRSSRRSIPSSLQRSSYDKLDKPANYEDPPFHKTNC